MLPEQPQSSANPENIVIVRQASPADVQLLVAFNAMMAMETEELKLDVDRLSGGVSSVVAGTVPGTYLVAEAEGEVVGGLMITSEWSDWRNGHFWWIQSVFVVPRYRRRGVYRRMYEKARQLAKENGNVVGLRLYVEQNNTSAQEVYFRMGMRETPYRLFEEEF